MESITADVTLEGTIVSQYDTYRLNQLPCRNIKLKITMYIYIYKYLIN
jgi:hypothetical protein